MTMMRRTVIRRTILACSSAITNWSIEKKNNATPGTFVDMDVNEWREVSGQDDSNCHVLNMSTTKTEEAGNHNPHNPF